MIFVLLKPEEPGLYVIRAFGLTSLGDHSGELEQQRPVQQEEGPLQKGARSGRVGGERHAELPGERREDRQGEPVPQRGVNRRCRGRPQARCVPLILMV